MQKNTNVLNPNEMNNLKGGGGKLVFTKNTLPKLSSQSGNTMSNMTNKPKYVLRFDIHTLTWTEIKCP